MKKKKSIFSYGQSKKKKRDHLRKKLGSWYPIIKDIEDWDYMYCLDLEYHYLIRLRNCIKRNNRFVGCERTCERIQTLINMLDMIRNGTMIISNVGKEPSFEKLASNEKISFLNTSKMVWKANRHVNIRNASRFVNDTILGYIKTSKDDFWLGDLYDEKLWKLYHKFRETWMRTFWD